MFCPECGKSNKEGALFCEGCGAELKQKTQPKVNIQPGVQQNMQANNNTLQTINQKPVILEPNQYDKQAPKQHRPKKKMSLGSKVAIVVCCVIVIAGIAAYQLLSYLTSPKYAVEQYAKSYSSHDINAMFSLLDVPTTEFTSAKIFESTLKNNKELHYEKTDKYTVETTKDGKTKKIYTISFSDSGHTFDDEVKIVYKKTAAHKFLLFDSWKMEADKTYLTKNLSVEAPTGTKAQFDNIVLDDSLKNGTDTADVDDDSDSDDEDADTVTKSYDVYKIPYSFAGKHDIKITSALFKDFSNYFTVDAGDQESEDGVYFQPDFDDFSLKQNVIDSVAKQADTAIQKLYQSALKNKGFEDAINSLNMEDTNKSYYMDAYNTLASDNILDSDVYLVAVTFKKYHGVVSFSGYDEQSNPQISVFITESYKSSSESDNINGTDSGNYDSDFNCTYHYINGQWCLYETDIYDNCISYPY